MWDTIAEIVSVQLTTGMQKNESPNEQPDQGLSKCLYNEGLLTMPMSRTTRKMIQGVDAQMKKLSAKGWSNMTYEQKKRYEQLSYIEGDLAMREAAENHVCGYSCNFGSACQ